MAGVSVTLASVLLAQPAEDLEVERRAREERLAVVPAGVEPEALPDAVRGEVPAHALRAREASAGERWVEA